MYKCANFYQCSTKINFLYRNVFDKINFQVHISHNKGKNNIDSLINIQDIIIITYIISGMEDGITMVTMDGIIVTTIVTTIMDDRWMRMNKSFTKT